jgi:hypothetical protein
MKLSELQIESNQLKIILKSLKQRRMKIREKENFELLAKTNEFSNHPVTKRRSIFFDLPLAYRIEIFITSF